MKYLVKLQDLLRRVLLFFSSHYYVQLRKRMYVDFPQSALQLPRNGGFNWPVSSRELGLAGFWERGGIAIPDDSRNEKPSENPAAAAAGNFRSTGDKRRKPLWTLLSCLTLSWRRDTSVVAGGYRSLAGDSKTSNKRATWRATAVPRWEKFRSAHIVYAARYKGDAEIPRNPADCAVRVQRRVCMCVRIRTYTGEGGRGTHTAALS